MIAVPDHIRKLGYPVAKDDDSRLLGELQVDLDMTVSIDKDIDIRVILDVFLGIENQVFTLLTHKGLNTITLVCQSRMLGPRQSEPHTPTGMEGREKMLAKAVMEDRANDLERLAGVAQAVAMCQIEYLSIELYGLWLLVEDDTTLALQIFVGPDVVVACEIVHLDTHIGQLGYLAKETGEALRHHIAVLVPEVEHIAQQIDGSRLVLDTVEETHQSALLHALMRNGEGAKVGVT